MESKILLETGTNELEVLEFTIAGNSYGINVAKIREIINYQPVTPVPNAHPSIESCYKYTCACLGRVSIMVIFRNTGTPLHVAVRIPVFAPEAIVPSLSQERRELLHFLYRW